jgi:hypothetical protein
VVIPQFCYLVAHAVAWSLADLAGRNSPGLNEVATALSLGHRSPGEERHVWVRVGRGGWHRYPSLSKAGENSPDNKLHNATDRPAFLLVSITLNGLALRRCRASRSECSRAETPI